MIRVVSQSSKVTFQKKRYSCISLSLKRIMQTLTSNRYNLVHPLNHVLLSTDTDPTENQLCEKEVIYQLWELPHAVHGLTNCTTRGRGWNKNETPAFASTATLPWPKVFQLQLPSGCAWAATDLTQVQAPGEREIFFPMAALVLM